MAGERAQAAIWKGVPVLVTLSDESATGFLNVLKQPGNRKKPFYVKFKVEGEKWQRTLPGSPSASAWEAACKSGSSRIKERGQKFTEGSTKVSRDF